LADGPALRANALITWANYLIAHSNTSYVTSSLWPVIKLDLDYVATNWNQTTQVPILCLRQSFNPGWFLLRFDLWEEISSSSFFTTAVQHRSLRQGAALATALGQTSVASGYKTQADNLLCFLQVCNPHSYTSDPLLMFVSACSHIGTRQVT
jgi:glucoamylase